MVQPVTRTDQTGPDKGCEATRAFSRKSRRRLVRAERYPRKEQSAKDFIGLLETMPVLDEELIHVVVDLYAMGHFYPTSLSVSKTGRC